jgi:MSHA pilin protein MshC
MQCRRPFASEHATRPGSARPGFSVCVLPSAERGFTLLELILVLVLLGIVAIVAAPRFATQNFDEAAFQEEARAALRYAQKLAVASGCEIQVAVDAGAERLSLTRRAGGTASTCGSGGFTEPVDDPADSGPYVRDAGSEVDVTSGLTVVYDSLGRPSAAGVITIGARSVTVEAESGYVR